MSWMLSSREDAPPPSQTVKRVTKKYLWSLGKSFHGTFKVYSLLKGGRRTSCFRNIEVKSLGFLPTRQWLIRRRSHIILRISNSAPKNLLNYPPVLDFLTFSTLQPQRLLSVFGTQNCTSSLPFFLIKRSLDHWCWTNAFEENPLPKSQP